MKFTVCQFKPKGSFHLGEREKWLEGTHTFIHSDTLFSAFLNAFLLLFGEEELKDLINRFEDNNPDFLISSAFPYWQDRLFFPVSKNQIPTEKKVKKIQFIEKEGFEQLLKGKKLATVLNELKPKTIPQEEEPRYPWNLDNVPRVGLSRLDNHPGERFFYFGEVNYKEDAGFFFLIRYLNEGFKNKFEATMNLLADEGIGGDRSSGKGFFEYPTFKEIEIEVPDNAEGVITLSLYYPKDESEIEGFKNGFYDLLERKGYIYSPYCKNLRRKSVRMFSEGSVFPKLPERQGRLVSVKPDIFTLHQVYRYGYLFSLPCQLEVKDEN